MSSLLLRPDLIVFRKINVTEDALQLSYAYVYRAISIAF